MELLFYKSNVCEIPAQRFNGFQRNCYMLRAVPRPEWLSGSLTPMDVRGAVKSCRFLFLTEKWFGPLHVGSNWFQSCSSRKKIKSNTEWISTRSTVCLNFQPFLLDFVGLVIMANIFQLPCSCRRRRWLWPCWIFALSNCSKTVSVAGTGVRHELFVIMNS